jgi:hypothetical protein
MLRFPRALWIALALAILLPAPSLFAELYCDDQAAVLRLEGVEPAPVPGPWHLYTFTTGRPDQWERMVAHGPYPWWTLPDQKLSLLRPLSSALFALVHAIAGRAPLLYHLHALAWYAAAVAAAVWLLRRLLPEREAALAGLLFAIAPTHWMAPAWPSAQHLSIAGALGFLAVGLHVRAREAGSRRAAAGALALGAIALSASEASLGVLGFVAAYELLGRDDAPRRRAGALAPWAALFAAYAIVYKVAGAGVHGSGGYLDPVGEPLVFAAALPVRLLVLAAGALLGLPPELTMIEPTLAPAIAIAGALAVVLFAALLRRALRRVDPAAARAIRWLLAGAALAALPGAAGIPGGRTLFLPSAGVVAAAAVILLHARPSPDEPARARIAARAGWVVLALTQGVLAVPGFLAGVGQLTASSRAAFAAAERAEIPRREGVRVVAIGLFDPVIGMYLSPLLRLTASPPPAEVHLLTASRHDHRVRRVDERTLEIEAVRGRFLDSTFENVARSPRHPLRAGDTIAVAPFTVRVLADEGGLPTRFAATFDRPIEDPSLAIVHWKDGRLRAIPPLAIGEEAVLRHEPGPGGL